MTASVPLEAPSGARPIEEIDITELLNPRSTISTRVLQSADEAPSIITVITRADIEAYGARDLVDILRMVPGFEFGMDVAGLFGVSFRGIWAYEGKILLMINGLTVNDYAYGNVQLIGSFPASMIERVEIIRGPGSAVYGGFAEVTTVNIVTFTGKNLRGARVSVDGGTLDGEEWARNGNLSVGTFVEDMEISAHVGYGLHPTSKRIYRDFFGGEIQLGEENSFRRWQHVVLQGAGKGLSLSYARWTLTWPGQDGFVGIMPPVQVDTDGDGMTDKNINSELGNNYGDAIQVKYKLKINDEISVEPLIEYARGNPIVTGVLPGSMFWAAVSGAGVTLQRGRAELALSYDNPEYGQAALGGGYLYDWVENITAANEGGLQIGPTEFVTKVRTDDFFGFAQYTKFLGPVGATVGARYEHTDFGNAFAPRVGLTFNAAPFTAKVLYGRAFRIPLPWQAYSVFTSPFSASPNPEPLRPETADTIEVEAGYKVSDNMRARLNGFYIHVDDPIVYNGGLNLYNNSGQMNSAGAEGELQVRYPGYGGFVNFSYHRPVGDTSGFFLSEDEGAFLGHPPIKINAAGYLTFDKFQFGPSVTFLSERHGQTIEYANIRYDATMPNVDAPFDSRTYPVRVLVNANLLARDIVPDVDVSLAAHNIFDTRYVLIQPYYGGHANMPANDRQVTLSLVWHTL